MEKQDHERRISSLEASVQANFGNVALTLNEIKLMIAASAQQRETMITQLAVISTKQEDFNKYQETCEADRQKLATDLATKTTKDNKRFMNLENFQKSQKRTAAGIATIATLILTEGKELFTNGSKILEKMSGWFS